MMEGIKKGGAGKVKIHGIVVDEAIFPQMNKPGDAKVHLMKVKMRKSLYAGWDNGVSDGG